MESPVKAHIPQKGETGVQAQALTAESGRAGALRLGGAHQLAKLLRVPPTDQRALLERPPQHRVAGRVSGPRRPLGGAQPGCEPFLCEGGRTENPVCPNFESPTPERPCEATAKLLADFALTQGPRWKVGGGGTVAGGDGEKCMAHTAPGVNRVSSRI